MLLCCLSSARSSISVALYQQGECGGWIATRVANAYSLSLSLSPNAELNYLHPVIHPHGMLWRMAIIRFCRAISSVVRNIQVSGF